MNSLFIVIIIELIFLGLESFVSRNVIVNPSFLAIIVLFFSTLFGCIGNIFWQVEISPQIIYVILLGLISIVSADILAKVFITKRKQIKSMPL